MTGSANCARIAREIGRSWLFLRLLLFFDWSILSFFPYIRSIHSVTNDSPLPMFALEGTWLSVWGKGQWQYQCFCHTRNAHAGGAGCAHKGGGGRVGEAVGLPPPGRQRRRGRRRRRLTPLPPRGAARTAARPPPNARSRRGGPYRRPPSRRPAARQAGAAWYPRELAGAGQWCWRGPAEVGALPVGVPRQLPPHLRIQV